MKNIGKQINLKKPERQTKFEQKWKPLLENT